jgi:hypothetical protein
LKRLQEEEKRRYCPYLISLTGYFANLEEHSNDQHDRAVENKENDTVMAQLLDDRRSSSSRRSMRRSRLSSRSPVVSVRPVATKSSLDTTLQRGHRRTRLSHIDSGVGSEPSAGRTLGRRGRLRDARAGNGKSGLNAASVGSLLDVAVRDVPLGVCKADLLEVHVEEDVCGAQERLAENDVLAVVDRGDAESTRGCPRAREGHWFSVVVRKRNKELSHVNGDSRAVIATELEAEVGVDVSFAGQDVVPRIPAPW